MRQQKAHATPGGLSSQTNTVLYACVSAGLLSRPRIHMEGHDGLELHKAPAALPGVVLTPADPNNLEPEAGGWILRQILRQVGAWPAVHSCLYVWAAACQTNMLCQLMQASRRQKV